jgi:squalene-associated FAD-dependent desaturase
MLSVMKKRVAIIGAGVSGLAAAIHLDRIAQESGDGNTQITIFDARRQGGGRTRSYIDRETGDTLDNGQHLLMGCYRDTLEYCGLIGTASQIDWQETMEIPFFTGPGESHKLRLAKLPSPLHLLYGLVSTDLLSFSEKLAALRFGQALKSKRSFDGMTCAQLMAQTNQPASIVTKLWEPMVLAVLNASVEQASAAAFVEAFRLIYFGKREDASLIFPRIGLSELLVDPAIGLLTARGHELRLGQPVSKISAGLIVSTASGDEEFDAVILAATVGPDISIPIALPTMEYSPILNAYFWLDGQVLDFPVTAFIGRDLQWAFTRPTSFGAQRLALTVSAAGSLIEKSNEELTELLWNDLKSLVPAARDAKLLKAQIIKEKRATPLFTPEAHAARPPTETAIRGLYLAGDIVQNGLPATIEGAIRNGKKAAEMVSFRD